MNLKNKELARKIGRGQKRLKSWINSLNQANLNKSQFKKARELMQTYALLMSKATKSTSNEDYLETTTRLSTIEQELNVLFDLSRLITNKSPLSEKLIS
jgi:hypothetical protein